MYLHHPQEINLGQLTAFFLYVNRFFSPIQLLVQQYNTFQQGQASVIKLRGLLEIEPSVLEAPDAVELPADPGRDPLRPRVVRLRPGRARAARRRPDDRARRDGGLRRRHRGGQVDDGQARHALLRPHGGPGAHRRLRPQARDARLAALAAGRGAAGAVPLRRDHPGQHRVRPARRARRRGLERGAPGRPGRARAPPAVRVRHAGARAGPVAVLGRAPAHRPRPGLHGRAPGPRARRGDLEPRPASPRP